jgi:predicted alpha/beta superfamily hydrolase
MPIYPPVSIPRSFNISFASKVVGDTYQIHLRLPHGFDQTQSLYPVLILLDSDDLFPLASTLADSHFNENLIPEMIIAGIGYGAGIEGVASGKNHRERDYLPIGDENRPDVDQTAGAPSFIAFIEHELLPYLEATFRTDPQDRALAGISFGGVFALFAFFCHAGMFQRYFISSPSLSWGQRVLYRYEQACSQVITDIPARIYLSCGTWEKSLADEVGDFYNLLSGKRYSRLKMKLSFEEGGHLSSQPGALAKGLTYLYEDFRNPDSI